MEGIMGTMFDQSLIRHHGNPGDGRTNLWTGGRILPMTMKKHCSTALVLGDQCNGSDQFLGSIKQQGHAPRGSVVQVIYYRQQLIG